MPCQLRTSGCPPVPRVESQGPGQRRRPRRNCRSWVCPGAPLSPHPHPTRTAPTPARRVRAQCRPTTPNAHSPRQVPRSTTRPTSTTLFSPSVTRTDRPLTSIVTVIDQDALQEGVRPLLQRLPGIQVGDGVFDSRTRSRKRTVLPSASKEDGPLSGAADFPAQIKVTGFEVAFDDSGERNRQGLRSNRQGRRRERKGKRRRQRKRLSKKRLPAGFANFNRRARASRRYLTTHPHAYRRRVVADPTAVANGVWLLDLAADLSRRRLGGVDVHVCVACGHRFHQVGQ